MHEIAICETILNTVKKEAAKRGMAKVSLVQPQVGKMEAFDMHHIEDNFRQ